ncbi:ribosomal RNA small subunit methyltransferase B [Plesiocystis pacifica SIR-1]|uniref:Ribosomal RNA small subunit methyltransferase B n=1 Tax=Plesiocystis pacifica SIR-1 TaxID=391625 RepID=A6FYF2_9BACT|nr:transcription antitermination factor NusB [Plesiocystis pacifica]EDM81224.1 ribosomal RNA small subunit methyltransferase B [Plesiocystis pacifica SIR-1]
MARPRAKSPLPNPRRLAVRTLREIEQRQGFSNRILSEQLERFPDLDPRDRGLITTLVYGVLRHRGRLDAHLDAAADKPHKLKGELRTILRVAAYEVLELDRPLPIASAEASKAAKRIDPRGRLKGMIAKILAKVAKDKADLDARLRPGQRWSLPAWLVERWSAQLGAEGLEARARALTEVPSVDLRVDLSRSTRDAVREQLVADHPSVRFVELPEAAGDQPQCLRVRGGGDLFHGPLFEDGLIAIQSLGSQQAVRVLDPQPGERTLDACAGMGTKTIQIAEHMGRRGALVASDASAERLDELERSARARIELDADGIALQVVHADLAGPELPAELDAPPDEAGFDAVLLDAPCTGLGNLARHPELRWTSQASDVLERAGLQASLLERCAAWVRPGGRLVYAVCSLEPEEGPAIVDAFLATEAGAAFEQTKREAWTPEAQRSDGFWLARLDRVR